MNAAIRFAVIISVFWFLSPVSAYAEKFVWMKVEGEIENVLTDAVKDYEKGKTNQAMEKVADAYFAVFEGEKANMEIAVRKYLSLKKVTELEKGFADIRKAMFNKIPAAYIKKQTTSLIEKVKAAAKELDRKGVGMEQ